jgi:cytoskeleton protein RodZ
LLESFGAKLRREREQRKMTLEDVSLSTKIATRHLCALEEDKFDQLPGGIFNKGFVRAYAHHLGIDEQQAVADYLEASGANQPPTQPETPPILIPINEERREAGVRIPWGTLALGLLIVAVGFATWGFYTRESPSLSTIGHLRAKPPAPAGKPVIQTPKQDKKQSPPETAASDAQPKINSSGNEPVTAPQPPSAAAAVPQQTSPAAPGVFSVSIKAHEDSWVTITADGTQIMKDKMPASAERSVDAHTQIVLTAGNIGALDLFFNGKKLPPQGEHAEVKTLTFNSDGLQSASTNSGSQTAPVQ